MTLHIIGEMRPPISAEWTIVAQESDSGQDIADQLEQLVTVNQVTIWDVIFAAAIVILAFPLAALARRLVRRFVRRSEAIPESVAPWAGSGVYLLVLTLAVFYALSLLGLETAPVALLLIVVVIVVVLSLRPILENASTGILLQSRKPIAVGDQIRLDEYIGVVREINTHDVVIVTPDGRTVRVPNSIVFSSTMVNDSAMGARRTDISVEVPYGTDLARARDLLAAIVADVDGVFDDPKPEVLLKAFEDSGIEFEIRYFREPLLIEEARTRDRVIEAVDVALREDDIIVPYPQLDVRIVRNDSDATAEDQSSGDA